MPPTTLNPPAAESGPERSDRVLRLGVAGLVLLLLSLPLAHVGTLRSIALIAVLLAAGYLYLSGQVEKRLPLPWIFAGWLGAALLSLLSATQPMTALALIWNEVIRSTLLFYASYVLARTWGRSGLWFQAASASLGLLAALGIGGWLLHGSWQNLGPVPGLGDYNTSALTLMPLVVLPLFAAWREPCGRAARPLAIAVLGLALLAALLTMSRGFWLVAGLMFALTLLPLSGKVGLGRRRLVLWLGGVALFCLLLAFAGACWRGLELLRFVERSVIYGPVLEHLKTAPWTGFGYGHEAQREWYLAHIGLPGVMHAHNIVLSFAEQMGIPGLLALLALFAGLALRFVRHLDRDDLASASLAALGLALVVGIFVRNNLDIFFVRHNLLLFFVVCGLMLGVLERKGNSNA